MELSAKELRIGNWIERINSNDRWIKTRINLTYLSLIVEFPEDYRPIKISEQWLKDFGFEILLKEDEIVLYRLNSNDVNIHPVGGFTYGNRGTPLCKIQYLHQLQNLYFALTGKELIIKEKTIT